MKSSLAINAESDAHDKLISTLIDRDVSHDEFLAILNNNLSLEANIKECKTLGIPLCAESDTISLRTKQDIFQESFCVVDIETNGNSLEKCDIIEIGAIKYRNGKILDTFESFIKGYNIPAKITELTGIYDSDIAHAPRLKKVLWDFKNFLSDCVFVAHSVSFDFHFINAKLAQANITTMKNRSLCTLKLARKTIPSQKHGLEYLNEFLGISYPIRHRAYADCHIALKVLEHSLCALDSHIKSTEDIIKFIN